MCPYRERDEDRALDRPGAAATRRANLRAYLDERRGASSVLVGEAMGYRGGRFSGVAFTAERQLDLWGDPYRRTSTTAAGWAEPSATIVHGALAELGRERDAVLWNSVPAHPYRPGRPLSNRLPTAEEVRAGLPYLDLLLELVRPRQLIAVGRVAERLLGDRVTAAVRHPAQGGATACRAGLRALLS